MSALVRGEDAIQEGQYLSGISVINPVHRYRRMNSSQTISSI